MLCSWQSISVRLSYLTMRKVLYILLILWLPLSKSSASQTCGAVAQVYKKKGYKLNIFESPGDKHEIILANSLITMIVNNKYQLVVDKSGRQQILAELKKGLGDYFHVELSWAGDQNNDCQIDLVYFIKPGAYGVSYNNYRKTHEEVSAEKFNAESTGQKNPFLKIQSLGQY